MNKFKETVSEKNVFYYADEGTEKSPLKTDFFLRAFIFFILGLGFGSFNAFGDISPFAPAFLSAVTFSYCLPSFIGTALGSFVALSGTALLRNIISLSLICVFRLVLFRKYRKKEGTLICPAFAFFAVTVTSIANVLISESPIFYIAMSVGEGLLTLCSGYFFVVSLRTPVFKGPLSALEKKNIFCIMMSVCLSGMCLSFLNFQGISLGRILVSVIIMFISIYKGAGASSVSGALAGIFLSFVPDGEHLFPSFVASALIAGAVCEWGQVAVALIYTLIFTVTSLVCGDISVIRLSLTEPVIACVCFLLIPAHNISKVQDFLDRFVFPYKNITDVALSDTLRKASDNILSVSHIVRDTGDRLEQVINPEINRLFSSLQQKVCDGCRRKSSCWKKEFDSTASDVLFMMGLESTHKGSLKIKCERYELLEKVTEKEKSVYSNALATKNKIGEMRRILTDQFICLSDFLSELSDNVCESRTRDKGKSAFLKTALKDSGIPVEHLDCFCFRGRISVELSLFKETDNSILKKIRPVLEFVTGRFFEEGEIHSGELSCLIVFRERATCCVKSGYAQRPLKPGSLCGDTVSIFTSENNFFNALISDGMGTGSRAAVDSNMAVRILEKLVMSDFSFGGAMKIVNSALIIKSTDETISTLDAVSINPYTCTAEFYKAGGALTFIRQGDRIRTIEKISLPMGIIRNVSPAYEKAELKKGDIILMVSDGVTGKDCGWINDELLAWSKSDMQSLAGHIASLARLRSERDTADDITVVALKIV